VRLGDSLPTLRGFRHQLDRSQGLRSVRRRSLPKYVPIILQFAGSVNCPPVVHLREESS
jgi:hypothetical protein